MRRFLLLLTNKERAVTHLGVAAFLDLEVEVNNYRYWSEYTNEEIYSEGIYYNVLREHLNTEENIETSKDIINQFINLEEISQENYFRLISACDAKVKKNLKYDQRKKEFEYCIKRTLQKRIEKERLIQPFYELLKSIMKKFQCENLFEIYYDNTKSLINRTLKKAFQLLKRYYQERKLHCKEDFETWVLLEGYNELFNEYPILFRIIYDLLESEVKNLKECIDRISEDSILIKDKLGINTKQNIIKIIGGVSDRHNNGKTVIILQYKNSDKIVYKPRNMSVDIFWRDFLQYFRQIDNTILLRGVDTISMDGYGYAKYIQYMPVMNAEELKQYYYQCGALLSIISLLNGSDFHYENLIVSNGIPVLVDVETLITSYAKSQYVTTKNQEEYLPEVNVIKSLLLSKWVGKTVNGAVNIGAFMAVNEKNKNYPKHENGNPAYIDEYMDDFMRGFRNVFLDIIKNKKDILRLVEKTENISLRFVLRNTRVYYQLIDYLSNPMFLKNGSIFECATMRIYAPFLLACTEKVCKKVWGVPKEEREAIKRFNIPLFIAKFNSRTLYDSNGNELVEDFFGLSPKEILGKNLKWHTMKHLETQIILIKKIINVNRIQREESFKTNWSYNDGVRNFVLKEKKVNKKIIEDEITKIYMEICNSMLDKNKFLFLVPNRDIMNGRYDIGIMNNGLYSGNLGIYLFLTMYYDYFDKYKELEKLDYQIKQYIENYIKNNSKLKQLDLGYTQGVAGILAFLYYYRQITQKEEYEDYIEKIVMQIPTENVLKMEETDLFNGVSGLLYIICLIYQNQTIKQETKNLMHILTNKVMEASDPETMLIYNFETEYKPLTGIAHGQCGYALALAYMLEFAEEELKTAIINKIRLSEYYEKQQYCEKDKNIPDYRKFSVHIRNANPYNYEKRYMYGKCSGIIGCTQAYMKINNKVNIRDLDDWIKKANDFLNNSMLIGNDSLCCGTSSWIEYLIELQKKSEYKDWCDKQIWKVFISRKEEGYVFNAFSNIRDISLYKGLAGVGYTLLRYLKNYPDII